MDIMYDPPAENGADKPKRDHYREYTRMKMMNDPEWAERYRSARRENGKKYYMASRVEKSKCKQVERLNEYIDRLEVAGSVNKDQLVQSCISLLFQNRLGSTDLFWECFHRKRFIQVCSSTLHYVLSRDYPGLLTIEQMAERLGVSFELLTIWSREFAQKYEDFTSQTDKTPHDSQLSDDEGQELTTSGSDKEADGSYDIELFGNIAVKYQPPLLKKCADSTRVGYCHVVFHVNDEPQVLYLEKSKAEAALRIISVL